MELIDIALKIEGRINELSKLEIKLEEYAILRARAIVDYELELAKKIVSLKGGKEFTLEGEIVRDVPTTIIEKIARGLIHEIIFKKEVAESNYKNILAKIEIVKAQLNGYQSINKHLTEM
jgi:hypothetical protein